jgi:hypothetical protein
MNYTIDGKVPLSPYSMFRVLSERGSDDSDSPPPAQFRLAGTVVMDGNLVGMRGGNGLFDGYNPFDLYGAAERARGKALPPHIVFAELDKGDPRDACAFLNAYGPLEGTNSHLILKPRDLNQWKKLALKSPSPEEHFRSTLGEVPLLPGPPAPQDDFYEYQLVSFWEAQSDYEFTLRLSAALNAQEGQPLRIQRTLAAREEQWDIHGRNRDRQYIERAREVVMSTLHRHLSVMQPRIARVPNSAAVTGVWGCYSLLQAMYLMLFLDIAGWSGRIAQCEKCHSLFYTALQKAKYCSPACENRARALRAYHKKAGAS